MWLNGKTDRWKVNWLLFCVEQVHIKFTRLFFVLAMKVILCGIGHIYFGVKLIYTFRTKYVDWRGIRLNKNNKTNTRNKKKKTNKISTARRTTLHFLYIYLYILLYTRFFVFFRVLDLFPHLIFFRGFVSSSVAHRQ